MYRRDSLSQISQIGNHLEKQKLQKQIIQGDINQGGKLKDRQRKWVFSQDYQIPDVCFPHQFPKKREDNKFQLNRLLIFDSLVSCFTVLILAKKHKIVFGFMNFPNKHSMRNTVRNVCNTMFVVTVTNGSLVICLEIIERLREKGMIFNIRLCFVCWLFVFIIFKTMYGVLPRP